MSHTPEPWAIKESTTEREIPTLHIMRGTEVLATLHHLGKDREEEFKGNARVLLNAPGLLNSLQELSEWMREHTGPRDGTIEMLTRAVETIKEAGGKIR